jgi:hypothetical protein
VKRLGIALLESSDIFTDKNWYWIGAAALLGFTIFFNVLFTLSLMYLHRKYLNYSLNSLLINLENPHLVIVLC